MTTNVPELELIDGTDSGQRFPLTKKRTRIGRANENEIIINDRLSSRVHTMVREVDGIYYVSDMDSRNGTKLNGELIKEEELNHGDEICIGTTTFRFLLPGTKSAPRQPQSARDDREFSEEDFEESEEEFDLAKEKGFDWKTIILIPITLMTIFIIWFYFSQDEKEAELEVIPLPANFSYGFIPNGDQKHADKVIFSFETTESDLYLTYKVWDIDKKGEVNIYLNREKIDEVEPTESGQWSGLRALKLPDELVSKAKANSIVFDNPFNPPGQYMWGVGEVDVRPEERFPCDLQKARQAYELGKKAYEDKLVVKSNLYRSIEKFTEADKYLKYCPEKPEFYFDNKLKLDEATRELNNQYKNHLFEYNKNKRLRRFDQAEIELRFLKELIPNPEDERHLKIKREERTFLRSPS